MGLLFKERKKLQTREGGLERVAQQRQGKKKDKSLKMGKDVQYKSKLRVVWIDVEQQLLGSEAA